MSDTVRFFNFWNAETYHFYQWVTKSKLVPVEALIAAAYDALEDDPFYKMGHTHIPGLACDALAEKLREILDNTLHEWVGSIPECGCFLAEEACFLDESDEVPNGLSRDQLFVPIAVNAARQIDCGVVAEAILRAAGKWRNISKEDIPDIFPAPGEGEADHE